MDPEDRSGVRRQRALVVRGTRPVRRPDLDESRSRAGEDVRDPEAVADLDQLAARDDDLATLGERGQREEDRRGVVVHDERRVRAGEPREEPSQMVLARSAGAALEVVLEIRVAGADLRDPRAGGSGERRTSEVRMDEHAGGVQHSAKAGTPPLLELAEHGIDERPRRPTLLQLRARTIEDDAGRDDRLVVRLVHQALVREQAVDGREIAKRACLGHRDQCVRVAVRSQAPA